MGQLSHSKIFIVSLIYCIWSSWKWLNYSKFLCARGLRSASVASRQSTPTRCSKREEKKRNNAEHYNISTTQHTPILTVSLTHIPDENIIKLLSEKGAQAAARYMSYVQWFGYYENMLAFSSGSRSLSRVRKIWNVQTMKCFNPFTAKIAPWPQKKINSIFVVNGPESRKKMRLKIFGGSSRKSGFSALLFKGVAGSTYVGRQMVADLLLFIL